jgi:hypothetical protein
MLVATSPLKMKVWFAAHLKNLMVSDRLWTGLVPEGFPAFDR